MEKFNHHNSGKAELLFTIDGNKFKTESQYLTGLEVKKLAGIPSDLELYLAIQKPWEDELISNDTKVDLARPEIEHFYCKKKLQITVDGKPYVWYKQYITGLEIKKLANLSDDVEIVLTIPKPWEDEVLTDDTSVDLARPGVEHFISRDIIKEVILIVNGKEKPWCEKTIGFEQVIELSKGSYVENAQTFYTVTYTRGPKENPEGEMVKGDRVIVKNKMIFNVTATDKS